MVNADDSGLLHAYGILTAQVCWLDVRVDSCCLVLLYTRQLNWANSHNDCVIMTASSTLSLQYLMMMMMTTTTTTTTIIRQPDSVLSFTAVVTTS